MILWCFSVSEISFANKLKLAIGSVSEVKGAPDVLREPSKTLTPDLKNKAKAGGYATVLYKNSYWKAYPIIPGSKIFYGDVLSSGPESKMVITLQDGFKIILAKNTKVRLTPKFIDDNPNSVLKTWLHVLNGKIRAYLMNHEDKPQTEFRTRTLAMGVRGTEFMLAVDEGHTKLLTIDGEIFARPIEKQEAEIFERVSEAFIEQDEPQLAQQMNQLQGMEIRQEISLGRGQKIERTELPPAEVMNALDPQSKAALLAQQTEFTSQAAQLDDLKEAQEIGKNIEQLIQDKKQNDLDSLTDEKLPKPPEKAAEQSVLPSTKPLLARIGLGNLAFSHPDIEASEGGLSFSLDYLPNPYAFVSLELGRGDWELRAIKSQAGLGPQDFEIKTKDSSRYLIGIGGRWPFMEAFSVAASLSYVGSRRLTLRQGDKSYDDYSIRPSALIRIEASYQVWNDWQLFLSFGGGNSRAKVHSSYPTNGPERSDDTLDLDQSYIRFGLGRFFDFR